MTHFVELVQAHALASHFVFAAELERGGLIRFVGERKIGGSGRWVGECGGRATHAELVSHESATPEARRHKSPSPPAIPALILSHVALRHCRMKIGENGTLQMNTKVLDNTHEHVTNLGPRRVDFRFSPLLQTRSSQPFFPSPTNMTSDGPRVGTTFHNSHCALCNCASFAFFLIIM